MTKSIQWTNLSVLSFANGIDPVESMEAKARALALNAMDEGWTGPPFDPLALAEWKGLAVGARGDIPDARTVPQGDGTLLLEYNPTRPRGRLRFSIAHEIAHSMFSDCADEIRHRNGDPESSSRSDNWQLEVLCNIGAAELLMPLGSFTELSGKELSIKSAMELRKSFDVSMEACLIRMAKLAKVGCAAFGASKHDDGHYRIDYVIPAPGWSSPVKAGHQVPDKSAITQANAIGFTAIGNEVWEGSNLRIECVGLAPYPGLVTPRVVGLIISPDDSQFHSTEITEVIGNALKPNGTAPKLIAHVIPDSSTVWGGNGFAAQVRKSFPDAWGHFKSEIKTGLRPNRLGVVYFHKLSDELSIAHMVAQKGIGPSLSHRLRYAALAQCLSVVSDKATELGATVHMPRIGTGHGGASWQLIKELIFTELTRKGVSTTIYELPK